MPSHVGVNLRASAYLHQGDRKYMEDEFIAAYQRTSDKKGIEYAFFGIFDGHGGKEAANYAKDNLMDNIVSQRLFWSDDDEDVMDAIKQGFIQTHLAMLKVVGKSSVVLRTFKTCIKTILGRYVKVVGTVYLKLFIQHNIRHNN